MTTPADVIQGASDWIGTTEQPPGSNVVPGITDWYGMTGPWCAMFVSRVFYDAGLPLPAQTPKGFAWCTAGRDWFRDQGRSFDDPRQALPGDVVFFDWDGAPYLDHVGIVVENRGDDLVTIEGNVGDRVGIFRRWFPETAGFGRPAYTTPRGSHQMRVLLTKTDGIGVELCAVFGNIANRWQTAPGGTWTDWSPILPAGPTEPVDSVTAREALTGELEVIAWNSETGKAFRSWQTAPGGTWTAWTPA